MTSNLHLIRHAPAATDGLITGRRDVPLLASTKWPAPNPAPTRLFVSPSLRCVQTAAQLFAGTTPTLDARLQEQDFGEWEGMQPDLVPDFGRLARDELAQRAAPGGESFGDLCARAAPAVTQIAMTGDATIIAHAGTIRAALALALGHVGAALAFEIAPLSSTLLRRTYAGDWAIAHVNRPL